MSYFQGEHVENNIIGEFIIQNSKKNFVFKLADGESWGATFGFPYQISDGYGNLQYAKIFKTVAYVVVGQDEYGESIIETWNIEMVWRRKQ